MKKGLLNLKKIGMTLTAVMLINAFAFSANFTAVASGNWSSSTTWGGTAPSFTNTLDVITIPAGITVNLDNNLTMNGLTAQMNVAGTLSSSPASALTVTLGSVTGTGTIGVANFTLGTAASLAFTGIIAANTMSTSILNLQSSAAIAVNQSLTLAAGTLTMQTGGSVTMAANGNMIMAGGLLAVNGGSLNLTNAYNVSYTAAANTVAGLELAGSGLKNVTVDLASSANTVTLSADLTVNGTLTLTNGALALGLSNLVIAGEVATNGNGTISSTVASDISITSVNGITGSVNFNGNNHAVNNFTVNVGGANHAQIKGGLDVNGSLNLASGTLMLDSAYLKLKGNIAAAGTGTISATASSVIAVNTLTSPLGAIRFTSSSVVKTFKVNITGGGSVKIGSDLFIQDTLTLTKGNLDIGANHIQVSALGIITGADSNSYIITGTSGFLSRSVTAGNLTMINFPVGTQAKYFPAGVLLVAGSTSGMIDIGVIPHVYDMGTTGVDLSTTKHVVDATWMIQSTITSNLNMNLNLAWSATAELNGFMRSNAFISHYTNTQWDISTSAVATLNASGLYSLTRTNISSLSPFTVLDHSATGINETANTSHLGVYPNPATEVIYVNNLSGNDVVNADVMNISGQVIASYQLTATHNSISLNDLKEGYYFVKLYNDQTNTVTKVIKL